LQGRPQGIRHSPRGRRHPAETHRCFTPEEDEHLVQVMAHHEDVLDPHGWEEVAAEMGGGMTARQVMDRWCYYLRPGLSRTEFTTEERRDCLRASMIELNNWNAIAARVGDGESRSSVQVKSVVVALQAKLERFHIKLHHPDAVDCLPDSFFTRVANPEEMSQIRREFLLNRISVLRRKLNLATEADVE
jgi:hypothetical protein